MQEKQAAKAELAEALVIQGGGFALGLATHMLLARWLGPAAYGDVAVTMSVAAVCTTLSLRGLDRFSSLKVSSLVADGQPEMAKAYQRFAFRTTLLTGLALAFGLFVVVSIVERAFGLDEHAVRYAALLIVPAALAALLARILTGWQRPLAATATSQLFGRVLLLATLALLVKRQFAASELLAVVIFALAWVAVLGLLAFFLRDSWRRGEPAPAKQPGPDQLGADQYRAWRTGAHAYLISALAVVAAEQSGVLILELLHSSEETIGLFAAAGRTATLPMIALTAVRALAVPKLAAIHKKDPAAIEDVLRPYSRFLAIAGVVSFLAFVIWGDLLLSLFGHSTERAHVMLVWLGCGFLVLLGSGLVLPLLYIYEERRLVANSMISYLGLTVILALVAVPLAGGEGVAASHAVAVLINSAYLVRELRRRTGIRYLNFFAR